MRSLDWQTGDRDELSAFIRSHLVAGFWRYDEILDMAHEWIDDSGVVDPREAAELDGLDVAPAPGRAGILGGHRGLRPVAVHLRPARIRGHPGPDVLLLLHHLRDPRHR